MRILFWFLAIPLFLTSCDKKETFEAIRPVKTFIVKEVSSSDNRITFPGTLRAFKRADLSFRVEGIVMMRDIYAGYRAQKDEVLVQLDPREYEIALQKSKGKVNSIIAQLSFAERDYERMKKIYEKDPGAISLSLVDRKNEAVNQLKAELMIATSDFDKAVDDLSYTSLKAPFDGIVAAIYLENYEQVRAKQQVLRFLDITDREMEIHVPEKYMSVFLEGRDRLNFEVRLDAFPDVVFNASIKEIGTEASSTTQTYPITLSLKNIPTELSLLAGMSGKAFFIQPIEYVADTFKIPKSAIFSDGRETYVWIVDPHTQTVHKRAVKLNDAIKEDSVAVEKGLNSGDRIVIAGTSFLLEGQKIKFDGESPSS